MRRSFILMLVLTLTMVVSSSAQDLTGTVNFTPFGGFGLPMGCLGDDDPVEVMVGDAAFRSLGIKFGAAVEYFFSPNLGVGMNVRYTTFGAKDVAFEAGTLESDSKVDAMLVGVHGKFFFVPEGVVRPYGIAGASLAFGKFKDVEGMLFESEGTLDFDVDTKFGVIFGGGVTYFVSPAVSVFGEATVDYWLTDGAMLELDGTQADEINTNYYFIDVVFGINIWFGGSQ